MLPTCPGTVHVHRATSITVSSHQPLVAGLPYGSGDAADEDDDGDGMEKGLRRCDGRFGILQMPPVSADPGEEALDDPSSAGRPMIRFPKG
jgi:hypothetical protein